MFFFKLIYVFLDKICFLKESNLNINRDNILQFYSLQSFPPTDSTQNGGDQIGKTLHPTKPIWIMYVYQVCHTSYRFGLYQRSRFSKKRRRNTCALNQANTERSRPLRVSVEFKSKNSNEIIAQRIRLWIYVYVYDFTSVFAWLPKRPGMHMCVCVVFHIFFVCAMQFAFST